MPIRKPIARLLTALPLLIAIPVAAQQARPEGTGQRPAVTQDGNDGPRQNRSHDAMGGNRRPRGRSARPRLLMLANGAGAVVTLYKPDLTWQRLPVGMGGRLVVKPTGMDNYHAIVAEQDWGDSKETIIRYETLRGEPSGFSPQQLLDLPKTDLEVVPDPLPREHYRYYSASDWSFCLRFRGEPLAGEKLHLTTANGSSVTATTGADGCAGITLPDDFAEVKPGRRNNDPALFQVAADYQAGGKRYHTLLVAEYNPNPDHWRSTGLALFVMGGGLFAGGLLGRVIQRNHTPAGKGGSKGSNGK